MKIHAVLKCTIGLAMFVGGNAKTNAKTNANWHLRRALNEDSLDEYYYGEIQSDDSINGGCIDVKDNDAFDGQKLILGDCKSGWRGDSDGLIHSELGSGMYCIQAGLDGPAKEDEYLRLSKCDASNDLQKFIFVNGGGIRPQAEQDLCIVWRGVTPNVGKDPLILKQCDEYTDRNDWSNDPF